MPDSFSETPAPMRSALGCLARGRGAIMVLGALGVGLLGWLVLDLLDGNLRESPDHAGKISEYARWMIERRSLILLAAIPPLLIGILQMSVSGRASSRSVAVGWALFVLGTAWEFAIFVSVLIAFLHFMAPLYQYQQL